jgi:hypothetical protein
MTEAAPIDSATRRLTLALDALEAAVERKIETERSRAILTEQVHALDADRARLASELDLQAARARRLEATNREVRRRIDAAMESVRTVLEAKDG